MKRYFRRRGALNLNCHRMEKEKHLFISKNAGSPCGLWTRCTLVYFIRRSLMYFGPGKTRHLATPPGHNVGSVLGLIVIKSGMRQDWRTCHDCKFTHSRFSWTKPKRCGKIKRTGATQNFAHMFVYFSLYITCRKGLPTWNIVWTIKVQMSKR